MLECYTVLINTCLILNRGILGNRDENGVHPWNSLNSNHSNSIQNKTEISEHSKF